MSFERGLMRVIAPAFALAIGLAACGDTDDPSPSKNTESGTTTNDGDVKVVHIYTPSGKRITNYEAALDSVVFDRTLAYCDGTDLVEMPNGIYENTSSIERSAEHSACRDGVLTESDFDLEP